MDARARPGNVKEVTGGSLHCAVNKLGAAAGKVFLKRLAYAEQHRRNKVNPTSCVPMGCLWKRSTKLGGTMLFGSVMY